MKKFLGLIFAVVLLFPQYTEAAVFRGAEMYSLNSQDVMKDDLYAGGASISIASDIDGDLVAAGGNVMVSGKVSQDLTVAGGSLTILGSVGDDLRAAGGQIVLSADIGDDAVIAGGSIHITDAVTISGDAVLVGGSVVSDGAVLGGLRPKAESVLINGTVEGDVEIWATKQITIGASAEISGKLTYHAPKEATIEPGAKIAGAIKFDETKVIPSVSKRVFVGVLSVAFLIKLIAWLIAAYVLVRVVKYGSRSLIDRSLQSFWPGLGRGVVIAIVMPVVTIVLFVTVIGSIIGLLSLLAYALLVLIAGVYSSVIFGAWLWTHVFKKSDEKAIVAQLVVGTILLSLISLIPFIGWIVCAIFFLVSLGVVSESVWRSVMKAA